MLLPKSSFAAACLLSLGAFSRVNGFQSLPSPAGRRSATSLGLTSEEILARARKASGIPEEPKIFEESLLNDMASALLKLERRVKEGPGSLSILDTEELDLEFGRIVSDMYRNAHKRTPKPAPFVGTAPVAPTPVAQTPVAQAPAVKTAPVANNPQPTAAMSEEGPEYDGKGGMGLSRGTANTYIIEGMDEMSVEEYRAALQQSLIDRQAQRRATGTTGNKATWDYLSSLGAGAGPQNKKSPSDKDSYQPFTGKS